MLSSLTQKYMLRYKPVNNQIISGRLQTMTHPVTIMLVYAPTAEAEEDVIELFYTYLQNDVSRGHMNDILIIVDDFNARVGTRERMDYSVMKHMDADKGLIKEKDFLILSMQMICTYPTQNSNRPNHQDARCGNPLTYAHTAKLTTFWSTGNSYLASKTADHYLVLTWSQITNVLWPIFN